MQPTHLRFLILGLILGSTALACADDADETADSASAGSGAAAPTSGGSAGAGGDAETTGGAAGCATLPVPSGGELCVESSAFGDVYIDQTDHPDGYSIIGFAQPDSCSYFLEVEQVIEEEGTPVSFLKVDLLGALPGTCGIVADPEPAVPHDGGCIAVVRTRRVSGAGKEDSLASSGHVVVTELKASNTLAAQLETTIEGRAVTLALSATHCPAMCACALLPDCPCGNGDG